MTNYFTNNFGKLKLGDRNQFVTVRAKYTDLYGIPYDYKSVMHYDQLAFTANSKPTIITKNLDFQNAIGTATKASENDYKKICGIYNCAVCLGQPFKPVTVGGNGEENDDKSIECTECNPISDCNKGYSSIRYYYNTFCCGNCGKKWWRNWCRRLSPDELVVWQNKGMCDENQ